MENYLFQTYHQRENVLTANFLFFLSNVRRISEKAYKEFLFTLYERDIETDNNLLSPKFVNQDKRKGHDSVPDATITQGSSNIIIETKGNGAFFNQQQLEAHIARFNDEDLMLLITLDKYMMDTKLLEITQHLIDEKNKTFNNVLVHRHIKFEEVIKIMKSIVNNQREFDLVDLIEDYQRYLEQEGLIDDIEGKMRMPLASSSMDSNIKHNIYYHPADKKGYRFTPVEYIGLYSNKAIRQIGKVRYVVKSSFENSEMKFEAVYPENFSLSEEQQFDLKEKIAETVKDTGWHTVAEMPHYFYVVEKFVETNFAKTTPGGAMGVRYFSLKELLNQESLYDFSMEEIAEKLSQISWE